MVTRDYLGRQIIITKSSPFLIESQSALLYAIAVKQYLWPEGLECWIGVNDLAIAQEFIVSQQLPTIKNAQCFPWPFTKLFILYALYYLVHTASKVPTVACICK